MVRGSPSPEPLSVWTGFAEPPRAYLTPSSGDPSAVAIALEAAFIDATRLSTQVPSGLSVGDYDVIVVNPDGSIGLLDQGFTVSVEEPPFITSVSPTRVSGTVRTTMTTLLVAGLV